MSYFSRSMLLVLLSPLLNLRRCDSSSPLGLPLGLHVCKPRSGTRCPGSSWSLHFLLEIEMVIMERSKLPELASTSMQEQNTTDEEKSAATGLESVQWSR